MRLPAERSCTRERCCRGISRTCLCADSSCTADDHKSHLKQTLTLFICCNHTCTLVGVFIQYTILDLKGFNSGPSSSFCDFEDEPVAYIFIQ